jgi:hypothetical protein
MLEQPLRKLAKWKANSSHGKHVDGVSSLHLLLQMAIC